jgi:hypothetical protein
MTPDETRALVVILREWLELQVDTRSPTAGLVLEAADALDAALLREEQAEVERAARIEPFISACRNMEAKLSAVEAEHAADIVQLVREMAAVKTERDAALLRGQALRDAIAEMRDMAVGTRSGSSYTAIGMKALAALAAGETTT